MSYLFDLSAAFDTIDHTRVIHRLSTSFGIAGTALVIPPLPTGGIPKALFLVLYSLQSLHHTTLSSLINSFLTLTFTTSMITTLNYMYLSLLSQNLPEVFKSIASVLFSPT
jgi:hypothetical protein